MNESRLDIAKSIIKDNYSDGSCGIFDCPNYTGDPTVTLYDVDGLRILICYTWEYFEVFGLTDEEFKELALWYEEYEEDD